MAIDLKITPRNLGCICLDGYCPRCFSFLLNLKFQPPFNHFGAAIFGDMQRSEEAIIGYYLDKDGCLPEEFAPFCDCSARAEYPDHYSKFSYTHKSGVILYGAPDEIFERRDGSLCVVDHKTAHNKGDKDKFHGQYESQVVGYANIAEGLGLGKVTMGGLLYWEAQVGEVQAQPSIHYKSGTLSVPFTPSTVEIAIDYAILDPLLKELKKVWNGRTLPEPREGCEDCMKRDLLMAIEEDFKVRDRKRSLLYPDVPSVRKEKVNRDFDRANHLRTLLADFQDHDGNIFAHDGVVSNWEFLPL